MTISPASIHRPAAFTLVELLVSMVVLLILVLTVAQLASSTSTVSSRSQTLMDTTGQARLSLDRLDADLTRILKRKDVDYIFTTQATADNNDAMFFYSESPGFFSSAANVNGATNKSSLALVGYRINKTYQLERLGKSLSWDGASPGPSPSSTADPGAIVFLTYQNGATTPQSFSTLAGNWPSIGTASQAYKDGTDVSYDLLDAQVFRMEVCFQLKRADGTLYYSTTPILTVSNATPTPTPVPSALPTPSYDQSSGSLTGMPDELVAVVTTIATLDEKTRLQNPGVNLQTIAAALKKPYLPLPPITTPVKLPAETWQNLIDGGTLSGSATGLTQANVEKIHIYQRVSYLNLQ